MSPLDVVILLKIQLHPEKNISQMYLAKELFISQSEVSKSLQRSRYAGLVFGQYKVMSQSLMDFLQYGIKYSFPQQPGPIMRGIPTAHSVEPLLTEIEANESYVWPSATGTVRGQSIVPLYPSVVDAVKLDLKLHTCLAMIDSVRVGRVRERELAIHILQKEIF